MALTSQQLTYLKTADQRFQAHVQVFAKYTPTITAPNPGNGTLLAPKPIPRISPRYSTVNHSAAITLTAVNTISRGGTYVGNANVAFALNGGSAGAVVDNGNGTGTYTAPSSGTGIAQINVTVSNANGSKIGRAFVAYPSTTYDNTVAEIASITASASQHGWKALLRVRGDTNGFSIGKGLLIHIEDTWAGTTSTFGGYQYAEGVIYGYIADMEYFEDYSGETWLGVSVESPWYILSKTPVGETHWGLAASGGNFYINDFKPSDALWHLLNVITDFTVFHDAILWHDSDYVIDDLIIDESDLATIIDDVAQRTLNVAYCDRYGSLFSVPDHDIHGDWWGTPAPIFDSGGAGALTRDYVPEYTVMYHDYQVKKLTLAAFDRSKRGIFAISENTSAIGDKREIRGLIADEAYVLAEWAVQKRAQMNRAWSIEVNRYLDHTVDLLNMVDVNFTAPNQMSGLTASGRTWVQSISYRPNITNGSWIGTWQLVKQTLGDGTAETGAISAYGGTGIFSTGLNRYTGESGSAGFGGNQGGWSGTGSPGATWCFLFDFVNSGVNGFVSLNNSELGETGTDYSANGGQRAGHVAGAGWHTVPAVPWGGNSTASILDIKRVFDSRTVTGAAAWASGQGGNVFLQGYNGVGPTTFSFFAANVTNGGLSWAGTQTVTAYRIAIFYAANPASAFVRSALLAGLGVSPFGSSNC